ncbi:MAG: glycoside hydrolase family 5 protein [Treponema sp.]|nr:glycoside hydrolase family 5 protein [Treponema sp.]
MPQYVHLYGGAIMKNQLSGFMKKVLVSFVVLLTLGASFPSFAQSKTVSNKSVSLEWYPTFDVEASMFKDFSEGNKICLKYENISADYHQVKVYAGDWYSLNSVKLEGAKNENGSFVPSASSGTIVYTANESEANHIRQSGLRLHGYGMKIASISTVGTKSGYVSEKKGTDSLSDKGTDPGSSKTNSGGSVTVANPKPISVAGTPSGTPFANHGALHVSGAYLYDSHNQKYQLYGMSTHGLNFGNDFSRYVNRDAFKTLRDDWNTNCIRLVLYPKDYNGYCNGGDKNQLKDLICKGIDYATELGMYVIVDWHVHQYNPVETQSEAIKFLGEISAKYGKYENVLYEICNEPTGSEWNSVLKPYAKKLISAIRKNAPDSIIIVGTNTWSQDIEGPLSNPLSYKNVMYTFHFYAQTHTDYFRTRVENAVKKGLPIFVTEFGTCDASGNGGFNKSQSEKWFDLLSKYNISHMNWSLSNKAETASAINSWCNKTSGWSFSDLTESGQLIYNHFRSLSR